MRRYAAIPAYFAFQCILCAFGTVVHEDNRTVAKVPVIGDGMYNGVTAVVLPAKGITMGYDFRWQRNMEKEMVVA